MSNFEKYAKLFQNTHGRPNYKAVVWEVGTDPTNAVEEQLRKAWHKEEYRAQSQTIAGYTLKRKPRYIVMFENGDIEGTEHLHEEVITYNVKRKAKHFSITPTKKRRVSHGLPVVY